MSDEKNINNEEIKTQGRSLDDAELDNVAGGANQDDYYYWGYCQICGTDFDFFRPVPKEDLYETLLKCPYCGVAQRFKKDPTKKP